MKIIKKILKTLLLILVTLVTLVLLAWSVLHIAKYFMYPDYYHNAEVLSPIPSLNEGFVPQGLDYDPETNTHVPYGEILNAYYAKVKEQLLAGTPTDTLAEFIDAYFSSLYDGSKKD
jgi:hypothetical protein